MLRYIALLLVTTAASAQAPLRFQWKAGEVHEFRVVHETIVTTAAAKDAATVITTNLNLTKTWTVRSVSADGSAVLTLAITAMKQELLRTGEDKAVIDSATPEGAKAMEAYLNKPILTVTLDSRGRVLDAKSDVPDTLNRLKAELPFRVEWPEAERGEWKREFAIKLDPPAGAGELYEAEQCFTAAKPADGKITIRTATTLKNPPKEFGEIQPLLPWLWEGEIIFDVNAGRYDGCKLKISRDYPNAAGAGSRFKLESRYEESRIR